MFLWAIVRNIMVEEFREPANPLRLCEDEECLRCPDAKMEARVLGQKDVYQKKPNKDTLNIQTGLSPAASSLTPQRWVQSSSPSRC